jgi:hypothetical protein
MVGQGEKDEDNIMIAKMKYFNSLFICISFCSNTIAQVSKDSELFLSIKKMDSILFERGFNNCDTIALQAIIHKDFVFYHDKGGIQNRQQFFEAITKNICSNNSQKPIRKVNKESLDVFPLYANNQLYGAIQNGTHHFYRREKGKDDLYTNIARFTHVYLLENGKWWLKEVLSFDHKEPK